MLKGGVIQSKNNTFVLIIAYFSHNADSNKEGNQTKDRHRIIISGSWFDLWIVANGAAVVGGVVDGVDVSGIGSDGAVI